MSGDRRPYVSFSRLGTFGKCPRQYRLQYVDDGVVQVPQGALFGGSATHECIEHAEAKELWASDEAMREAYQMFDGRFRELVDAEGGPRACRWGGRKTKDWPDGETAQWWLVNGPNLMLRTYAKVRREDADRGVRKVTHAELEVLCQLPGATAADGGPVFVKGYVDQYVLVTEDGELVVRDWKTGTSNAEVHQLASYCWQLAESGTTKPTQGEFVYLRRGSADKAIQRHDVAELVPLMPTMYADLTTMLKLAAEADCYPMQPNVFCIACKVRMACPYGRTLGPAPELWRNPEAVPEQQALVGA